MAVADFNRDGKKDIVIADYAAAPNSVGIMLGDGSGGFDAKTDFGIETGVDALAVGDFNLDGRADLAVVLTIYNWVDVWLDNGRGGFDLGSRRWTGNGPTYVAVADLNRDGKPDVVTANQWASTVSAWLNTTKPMITSAKPTKGRVGSTVVIAGSDFGRVRGTGKVFFGTESSD